MMDDCTHNNGKHLITDRRDTELKEGAENGRITTVYKVCAFCNKEFGVTEVIDRKQMIGDQGL